VHFTNGVRFRKRKNKVVTMDFGEIDLVQGGKVPPAESLFEQCHWFYAFCREYLFRDHTNEIAEALFSTGEPVAGVRLLELGCGPGVYACKFARRFPQIQATGIDLSQRLLERARSRADTMHLSNCFFRTGDAQAMTDLMRESVDAVIVSRLFLIVPDKHAVLAEIFRVLNPGGRCYITEPTSNFRTRVPLSVMWLLARLSKKPKERFREPEQVDVLSSKDFLGLVTSQPWGSVTLRNDDWYQSAVCVKAGYDLAKESAAQ
jgi:ubiquinone/menaquinone biosynthesis C-methylase UbiE